MNSNLKLIVTGFALSIVFTSCKKEEEAVVSDTPKEIILPRVQSIPTGNYVPPPQPIQQQQQQIVTPDNQVVNQTPQVVTKPGMNPPHGQAGHRCDIQVGAPLNSKPAAPAAPTTPVVTPGTAITQKVNPSEINSGTPALLNPDAAKTVTAPGMNPPHGEEGHQCGVAVGAPLPK